MATQAFDEPELYLLTNWASALLLEGSMKAVRDKYAGMLRAVLDQARSRHEELSVPGVQLTNPGINIGLGKATWPSGDAKWPSGLWLGKLQLQNVMSDEADGPRGYVWIGPPKDAVLDVLEIAQRLRTAAETTLPKEALDRLGVETQGKSQSWLWYELPEPRVKLQELLLNHQARGFIDCLASHFETLAGFVPVIDDITKSSRSGK